jgi:hypothetical protein
MVAMILIFAAAVILPAGLLWWLFRRTESSIRVLAALLGGQLLATPAMLHIAWQEAAPGDADPWIALATVAVLALFVAAFVAWGLEQMAKVEIS